MARTSESLVRASARTSLERVTSFDTNNQANKQRNKETNKQTNKQTKKETKKQTNEQTNKQSNKAAKDKGGKGSKGGQGGQGGGKGQIMCSDCQDRVRFSLFPSVLCVAVKQEVSDPQCDVASPVAQRLVAALRNSMFFVVLMVIAMLCKEGAHY